MTVTGNMTGTGTFMMTGMDMNVGGNISMPSGTLNVFSSSLACSGTLTADSFNSDFAAMNLAGVNVAPANQSHQNGLIVVQDTSKINNAGGATVKGPSFSGDITSRADFYMWDALGSSALGIFEEDNLIAGSITVGGAPSSYSFNNLAGLGFSPYMSEWVPLPYIDYADPNEIVYYPSGLDKIISPPEHFVYVDQCPWPDSNTQFHTDGTKDYDHEFPLLYFIVVGADADNNGKLRVWHVYNSSFSSDLPVTIPNVSALYAIQAVYYHSAGAPGVMPGGAEPDLQAGHTGSGVLGGGGSGIGSAVCSHNVVNGACTICGASFSAPPSAPAAPPTTPTPAAPGPSGIGDTQTPTGSAGTGGNTGAGGAGTATGGTTGGTTEGGSGADSGGTTGSNAGSDNPVVEVDDPPEPEAGAGTGTGTGNTWLPFVLVPAVLAGGVGVFLKVLLTKRT